MSKNVIKKVITLQKTKFLSFYHAIYRNKLGQEKNWFIASRKSEEEMHKKMFEGGSDASDAVLIIASHEEENKLVLIRQFRIPLNDYIYELPAGLIDPGEDMFGAAKRELKEETGLTLTSIDHEKCHSQSYLSPGMTDESVSIIYCHCAGEISEDYLEVDEDIETILISKEEAKKIIASGEKIDIKALMALQQFIMQ